MSPGERLDLRQKLVLLLLDRLDNRVAHRLVIHPEVATAVPPVCLGRHSIILGQLPHGFGGQGTPLDAGASDLIALYQADMPTGIDGAHRPGDPAGSGTNYAKIKRVDSVIHLSSFLIEYRILTGR